MLAFSFTLPTGVWGSGVCPTKAVQAPPPPGKRWACIKSQWVLVPEGARQPTQVGRSLPACPTNYTMEHIAVGQSKVPICVPPVKHEAAPAATPPSPAPSTLLPATPAATTAPATASSTLPAPAPPSEPAWKKYALYGGIGVGALALVTVGVLLAR